MLSPDSWQEISPYLDQALALTKEEREIWLASFLERNPGLGVRLEALLKEHRVLAREQFLEVSDLRCLGHGA